MNKSKGFTIIELIVVIAIIAILAAIVMVNVTQYISKAKDAAIKSDVGNIVLGMGSCFAETGTYVSCATNTAYVDATLLTDVNTQNGAAGEAPVFGTATATAYCVTAELATSTSAARAYVCADSTGVTKLTTAACSAAVCP